MTINSIICLHIWFYTKNSSRRQGLLLKWMFTLKENELKSSILIYIIFVKLSSTFFSAIHGNSAQRDILLYNKHILPKSISITCLSINVCGHVLNLKIFIYNCSQLASAEISREHWLYLLSFYYRVLVVKEFLSQERNFQ